MAAPPAARPERHRLIVTGDPGAAERAAFCPFCTLDPAEIILEGALCFVMDTRDPVLVGSAMIVPRAHRETVFDLTPDEWAETYTLLHQARALLDEQYAPDGYNVGWNCGAAGGQEVFHAHLHVIPRFQDEPLAGRGIRYAIKQPTNRRPGSVQSDGL
ncbi:MAG: HIT family protein [Chloroflexota bacterium]